MGHKIDAVRQAQEAGRVSKRFSPEILLLLVLTLTRMGAPDSPEAHSGMVPPADSRQAIADAVARLIEP